MLSVVDEEKPGSHKGLEFRLARFPEFFCTLAELRRFELAGHYRITAIPANISSLKNLEELTVVCNLFSLPKELGELSGLTKLDLGGNDDLGIAP